MQLGGPVKSSTGAEAMRAKSQSAETAVRLDGYPTRIMPELVVQPPLILPEVRGDRRRGN